MSASPQPATASVLLVGMHGAGKSTLALIAAKALGFRFVDTDLHVQSVLAMPAFAYIKEHGMPAYRAREHEILAELLDHCDARCVIACGAAVVEHRANLVRIAAFRQHHAVVHVLGDEDRILEYLNSTDFDLVYRMCRSRYVLYRECSNYEFFNISADQRFRPDESSTERRGPPRSFLLLKNSERDFVRYLKVIMGRGLDADLIAVPPPEQRKYTYAITLRFPTVDLPNYNADEYDKDKISDMVLGADCVEVVINAVLFRDRHVQLEAIAKFISTVRRNTPIHIIYTVSMADCDLREQADRKLYFKLLDYGLRLATRYINIDLLLFVTRTHDDATGITRYTQNAYCAELRQVLQRQAAPYRKIINSIHVGTPAEGGQWWTSQEPKLLLDFALQMECDIVRITKDAVAMDDNFAVLSFHHQYDSYCRQRGATLSAFNVGPLGRLSRVFNPIMTPVIAHYSVDIGLSDEYQTTGLSPVQAIDMTAHDAMTALYSAHTLPKLQFYVFGGPRSSQSLSPIIINAASRVLGLPHVANIHVSASADDMMQLARREDFGGMGITMPHKLFAVNLVDTTSVHARVIGAVNTVISMRDPETQKIVSVHGENTDWIGIFNCIRAHLSPVNAVTSRTTALVIGAGGSARASIYAFIRLGVEHIFIYNRTQRHAEELAEHFNKQAVAADEARSPDVAPGSTATDFALGVGTFKVHVLTSLDSVEPLAEHDMPTIIVSSISAYMEFPLAWFQRPTGGVLVELHYEKLSGPMARRIRPLQARGWLSVSGVKVLPEMAACQFELWTGKPAPRSWMQRALQRYYEEHVT
ncbi:uncharacterized protein V1518DRAFT_390559 [Limtongia smithiae]|uniref:uncharacterized protein n=1 Tax=Limtongia smithiae TaxID=1125753 RepID=UPI0034CFC230